MVICGSVWGLLSFLTSVQGVPRSVEPINAMVAFLMIYGSLIFAQWLFGKVRDANRVKKQHFDLDKNTCLGMS